MIKPVWPILCPRSSQCLMPARSVRSVYFHISNYEEVGHGAAAGIPGDVAELICVDMAVVGRGQSK